jgi:dTDP-4-dehydrorhamnose 3,5-epimerase-like enzyme/dTDP-4-dehydrorhamnose reductase
MNIEIKKIKSFHDNRGELKFTNNTLSTVKQQFISYNFKNVLRGIHCSPYGKIVTCLRGSVIDFIINLDSNSSCYLEKVKLHLTEGDQIYIPPVHGHAFHSLEDNTQLLYQLEGIYKEENELNINIFDKYIDLNHDLPKSYIISNKDMAFNFLKPNDYIILGSTGFIGSNICKEFTKQHLNFITLPTRLENVKLLESQLKLYKPKFVISAAGISGNPTVEWSEEHKSETLQINLVSQLQLAEICHKLSIHLTIIGSGLVFSKSRTYTEEDNPDKSDLYYSKVRGLLEEGLKIYPNVLYLRVIYPISGDGRKKCFLSKLQSRKDTIHDISINVTILPSLLKVLPIILNKNITGVLNFVNKNMIKLDDIMNIYSIKYSKPKDWTLIKSFNSQPELSTSYLESIYPELESVESLINYI